MKLIVLLLFIFSVSYSDAQNNRYLKVSGGKIFFGTGDVPGYGIYTEYAFRLQKQNYWKHFQLGGELAFETGSIQPESVNPPLSDYYKLFYHVSNTYLHARIAYYPIGTTFLKGLHVAIGPTAGYYLSSRAGGAEISTLPDGTLVKASYLDYTKYLSVGYKISAGYEFYFDRLLIGARLDWSNTQKGDMNIMYGAKLGWKL